jgi:type VI secretion system secreted protein VgrG
MGVYTQAQRPISVATPLGPDVLLLTGLKGLESLSQSFRFDLDLLAENRREIAFDKLLGQKITVRLSLPLGGQRLVNGICNRISQGHRDNTFTTYHMQIVSQFWLLTKRLQSRIFQHLSIPEILKKVLDGLDVVFEIQGVFQPRNFCVQYRESDFNFASRLMEEEGIYYFFKHTADGHKMVLANTPHSHPDVPGQSAVIFEEVEGGVREDLRVMAWRKTQELRAGKCLLWDHHFELPGRHLEAETTIQDSVQVGQVIHKLKVGGNDKFEIFDYPGGYAQRFDGIDRGGRERPAELQKIFEDNTRTAAIRMQEEAAGSILIHGDSNCAQFVPGHKFSLERHFNADGRYVLTQVEHSASLGQEYRSGHGEALTYENRFKCIPLGLPFRPPRLTPKPAMELQTATVVGPPGEVISTDKYGRAKVQFHWDRQGKNDADSSCWVRVSSVGAGAGFGFMNLPRVGQEVIIDFLEGDLDRPVILGSAYNAAQMPPYKLPDDRTQCGFKSFRIG